MFAALLLPHLLSSTSAPTGLLVDLQNSPALGVRAAPSFAWIVPPCDTADEATQTAYALTLTTPTGKPVWSSGTQTSSMSTGVTYSGPALAPGTWYDWTVVVTRSKCGASPPSTLSSFVTRFATLADWNASWISASGSTAPHPGYTDFAYVRKDIGSGSFAPTDIVRAAAFITGPAKDPMLCGYRLYLNGELLDVGPGRGEAQVWGGDGMYRSQPYTTLDMTKAMQGVSSTASNVFAIQLMGGNFRDIKSILRPYGLFRLTMWLKDGTSHSIASDGTWSGFNADVERNPGNPVGGRGSAGTKGGVEYINAMHEPVGWRLPGFAPTDPAMKFAPVTATPASASKNFPTDTAMVSKMEPPMQLSMITAVSVNPVAPSPTPAPTPPPGPAGTCVMAEENKDAKLACPPGEVISSIAFASFGTPTGSCGTPPSFKVDSKCNSNHSMSVLTALCMGKADCTISASCATFHEELSGKDAFCYDIKKHLDAAVTCKKSPTSSARAAAVAAAAAAAAAPTPAAAGTHFWVDFGREFQGGLILDVPEGNAGQNVSLKCGESITPTGTVGSTWGWEFVWTLRAGAQRLEQHKYMECRFVDVQFSGAAPPAKWILSAWKVHYPYVQTDSSFTSSNPTLNAVFELSRYTLEAASLDTYTDSNTRERRPYEADGIIAATARLLVQRDFLWPRHSHAWVIHDPTWPVEWKQISAFLAWQDYSATGQADLAFAMEAEIYDRTMCKFVNTSNGLLNTNKMGRHITDWMPDGHESDETVALGEFTASSHMSVSNGFGAQGLALLGKMTKNATYTAEATALSAAIKKYMWNGTQFCDGICSEVDGHSLMMTNMFFLTFNQIDASDQAAIDAAWKTTTDWGIENIGDYGAFWYMSAVAGSYYTGTVSTYLRPYVLSLLTFLTYSSRHSFPSLPSPQLRIPANRMRRRRSMTGARCCTH